MLPISRFHFVLAFVALMLLRVVVGFHFFKEGTDKLKSGDFTAEYFLQAAKGPAAPYFQSLIDDNDGARRFCIADDGKSLDPEITFAIWDDFLDRTSSHYRFGDAEIETKLVKRRKELATKILAARANRDPSVDTRKLEELRQTDELSIQRLRRQSELGDQILKHHQQEFSDWLDTNRAELLAYFGSKNRVNGFDRDGPSRAQVATYVTSLREQVNTIKVDRQKQKRGWVQEVDAIWDSYENEILALPIEDQRKVSDLQIHRPFSQSNSKLQWLNRLIPWFDTIVGALLILGLFTRLASLAGATFLALIIATQPPWIPGTEPTYLYAVELFALLVIFATLAGRFGGLDFFLARRRTRRTDTDLVSADTD